MTNPTRTMALLFSLFVLLTACSSPRPPSTTRATSQAPTRTATFGAAWQPVACDIFAVAPEIAARADCGYVTVPENRATASTRTIQLAVVRVRSTAANPGAPIVKGTGGPGGAGLQSAATADFLESYAGILADRDYIFFSQRGTQYARPELVCPAYNTVELETARNNWSAEEQQTQRVATMQACLDAFAAQGLDLTAYNSVENAADIDTIRQTLGYDKIVYYGESYGTLLGQFLLRNHPEIVEAIVLDGIAPATATRWTDVTDFAAAFERVFAACAADAACHAAYPDPEGALAQAMATLKANPSSFVLDMHLIDPESSEQMPLQIDETLAMNALFILLYIPGGYRLMPAIAYQLSQGDYASLGVTIPTYFVNAGTARVMHFAMVCSDDPVASLNEVNLDGVPDLYADLIADDALGYATFCPLMNLPQLPSSSDTLVMSDVPALLVNGGLDPATPFTGGSMLQAGLPNSHNIIVPAGSHIQSHSPCILGIMDAFLNDPLAVPDTGCIDQQIPFGVPQQVTMRSADGSTSISMILPPTFQAIATSGQWANSEVVIGLTAFAAGTSTEAALAEFLGLPALANVAIVDGPVVAGYPTRAIQTEVAVDGQVSGIDLLVFANERGTYRIFVNEVKPDRIATFRQTAFPRLLETVSVNGE